jgi:hypothetical protein
MHAIRTQLGSQKQAFRGAGIDAKTAALTLIDVDFHFATSLGHIHLDA